MLNKVGYRQYPDKEEFENLYHTHTVKELCVVYGCAMPRIRKWAKHFGLKPRTRGGAFFGGNNKKFTISYEELHSLVLSGMTRQEIADHYGMSRSNTSKWLKHHNIKRQDWKKTTEWQKYARRVRFLTESTYAKYKDTINPNGYPRTLCGVEGGYQLDHIISVRECFDSGVSVEHCSDVSNLQMVTWERNLQKRTIKGRFRNDRHREGFDLGDSSRPRELSKSKRNIIKDRGGVEERQHTVSILSHST